MSWILLKADVPIITALNKTKNSTTAMIWMNPSAINALNKYAITARKKEMYP